MTNFMVERHDGSVTTRCVWVVYRNTTTVEAIFTKKGDAERHAIELRARIKRPDEGSTGLDQKVSAQLGVLRELCDHTRAGYGKDLRVYLDRILDA